MSKRRELPQIAGAPQILRADEVRREFLAQLQASGEPALNYIEFYVNLRRQGKLPKGSWPKEHHRSIYNALKHPDLRLVAPGMFGAAEGSG